MLVLTKTWFQEHVFAKYFARNHCSDQRELCLRNMQQWKARKQQTEKKF